MPNKHSRSSLCHHLTLQNQCKVTDISRERPEDHLRTLASSVVIVIPEEVQDRGRKKVRLKSIAPLFFFFFLKVFSPLRSVVTFYYEYYYHTRARAHVRTHTHTHGTATTTTTTTSVLPAGMRRGGGKAKKAGPKVSRVASFGTS